MSPINSLEASLEAFEDRATGDLERTKHEVEKEEDGIKRVIEGLPEKQHIAKEAGRALGQILRKPGNRVDEALREAEKLFNKGILDVVVVTNTPKGKKIYVASKEEME